MTTITQLFQQHKNIFITGTDTEVGKTYCSALIVKHLRAQGIDVFPFKPIAAGTDFNDQLQQQVNEDALSLHYACDGQYSIEQINPIVFTPAIAPHIAANQINDKLDFSRLDQVTTDVSDLGAVTLTEGAGGWLLPLNDEQLLSDWVAKNQMPVIMVVAIKLGCLNHALLTAQAIAASGCNLVGWIANFTQGHSEIAQQNMAFIEQKLSAPLLCQIQKDQNSLYTATQ